MKLLKSSKTFSVFIFGFFVLLISPSLARADITTGLVGYWAFDDGSGTTAADSSGNSHNAALTGGPTWTTGQVGGALSFDGVDDTGYTTLTFPTSAYTLSIWAKKLGAGTSEPRQIFFGDNDANYLDLCFNGQPTLSVYTTANQYAV